jgi:hypothetical protein
MCKTVVDLAFENPEMLTASASVEVRDASRMACTANVVHQGWDSPILLNADRESC